MLLFVSFYIILKNKIHNCFGKMDRFISSHIVLLIRVEECMNYFSLCNSSLRDIQHILENYGSIYITVNVKDISFKVFDIITYTCVFISLRLLIRGVYLYIFSVNFFLFYICFHKFFILFFLSFRYGAINLICKIFFIPPNSFYYISLCFEKIFYCNSDDYYNIYTFKKFTFKFSFL